MVLPLVGIIFFESVPWPWWTWPQCTCAAPRATSAQGHLGQVEVQLSFASLDFNLIWTTSARVGEVHLHNCAIYIKGELYLRLWGGRLLKISWSSSGGKSWSSGGRLSEGGSSNALERSSDSKFWFIFKIMMLWWEGSNCATVEY